MLCSNGCLLICSLKDAQTNKVNISYSRKQHQYHSQRQVRHDNQLRPVSNFYEYESVQSILNTHARPGVTYPHSHQQQSSYQETTSGNSLPRQQAVQGRHGAVGSSRGHLSAYQQQQQQHRGPFVTHVTIGDHHPQQAGSRGEVSKVVLALGGRSHDRVETAEKLIVSNITDEVEHVRHVIWDTRNKYKQPVVGLDHVSTS
ncbi:hypothetical protein ILUMI_18251 [Ignelater luminosus]|uniref:Uncharacterized protein n=1 Tax=Ignelater luminosus TaxID=2038154 RepID=A0A8K0G4A7_IGNLU|nr:hypothetical protein ILUMI_18251 [Ignelater luminosus]